MRRPAFTVAERRIYAGEIALKQSPAKVDAYESLDQHPRKDPRAHLVGRGYSESDVIDLATALLEARFGMAGRAVSATLVCVGAAGALDEPRERMTASAKTAAAAISRVDNEVLLGRYLGDDAVMARETFQAARAVLRPELAGLPATRPRIWAT